MANSLFFATRLVFSVNKKFFSSRRIVVAILVIIFSLVPLIVANIVVEGMIVGISDRFISLGDSHIKIQTYKNATPKLVSIVKQRALQFPWVLSVTRSLTSKGIIIEPKTLKKSGVEIKAFSSDFLSTDSSYKKYIDIVEGECEALGEREVLLSLAVAKNLGIQAGQTIDILMIATLAGKEVPIKGKYKVAAIFQTGYYQLDNFSLYMNFDRVFPLFKEHGVILYVTTNNPYENIAERTQELRSAVVTQGNFQVTSWQTNNRTLFQSLQETKFLIYIILIGILVVTSFNILSTFFMMIKEKEQNIAILKSCGVPSKTIVLAFVLSSLMISFIGTTIGVGLGLLVGFHINQIIAFIQTISGASLLPNDYYLETIPIIVNWTTVLIFYLLSILLSLLFSFLPALAVTKIKVIDIIRKH